MASIPKRKQLPPGTYFVFHAPSVKLIKDRTVMVRDSREIPEGPISGCEKTYPYMALGNIENKENDIIMRIPSLKNSGIP
jgi:hypothetical protein